MQSAVSAVMCIGRWVDKGIVELGLAYVGLEAVHFLQSGGCVEGKTVGPEAHDRAVLLVEAPQLQVPVAAVRVPELMQVCDLCEGRTGVAREGMETEPVENHKCYLGISNSQSWA